MGIAYPGVFVSEFGTTSFSSFESLSPTLDPSTSWGIHAPDLFWRSFSQDNVILTYFGELVNRTAVGDGVMFGQQLLASEVGAALNLKSQIEVQRGTTNTMGMMLWQLGEIWPTGGWGSLEYAHSHSATKGQVAGGRWKPVHHLLEAVLFKDLLVACSAGGTCYARNDSPSQPFTGAARLTAVSVANGKSFALGADVPLALSVGPSAVRYFCAANGAPQGPCEAWDAVLNKVSGGLCNSSSCVLVAELYIDRGAVVAANPTLLAPPHAVMPYLTPTPSVTATLQDPPPPVGQPIALTVSVSAPVLFLTLTTQAQGHFEKNSELLTVGNSTVLFFPLPTAPSDTYSVLKNTLTLRHF